MMEKTERPDRAVAAKPVGFCCDRGAREAGGSCCDRMNLKPTTLPPAIKKAEKGKRAAWLMTFPSCKSQPASLHTPAPGANSRAGTWQTSSGTELPKEVGRACVCALLSSSLQAAPGRGSGKGSLASSS